MPTFTPTGYTTVAPWIVTNDTGALLDFITSAFDGTELARIKVEDGSIGHAEIRVGDTTLLAFDRHPDWPLMPSLLRIYVPDPDLAVEKAVADGARVITVPANSAWGDRGGRVRDPFGNIWWVMSHVEDVPQDQMWQRMSEPEYAESMQGPSMRSSAASRAGQAARLFPTEAAAWAQSPRSLLDVVASASSGRM